MTLLSEISAISDIIAWYCPRLQFPLASLGILINTLHLITLSQKSMRANAINVLLIGIAISDILYLSSYVYSHILDILRAQDDARCVPPYTWPQNLQLWISQYSRDVCRRNSTWLGVIMALIRAIVMRYNAKEWVNLLLKPSASLSVLLSVALISFLVSSINFGKLQISRLTGDWIPPERCQMYPANTSFPFFMLADNKLLAPYHYQITQAYLLIDGGFRSIPPILHPFLAGVLILELRKATKRRERLISDLSDKETDNTSKIVMWMTVSYVLVETPMGLAYLGQSEYLKSDDLLPLINNSYIIFTDIYMLYCSLHCVICFLLSSEYRKAMGGLFGCWRTPKPSNSQSPVVTF